MNIKELNEAFDKLLYIEKQEEVEKKVLGEVIRLAKEYYGEDYSASLKENDDKLKWDETPRGSWSIIFEIFGDKETLLSIPVKEIDQDYITDTVSRINNAIQYEELDMLCARYGI